VAFFYFYRFSLSKQKSIHLIQAVWLIMKKTTNTQKNSKPVDKAKKENEKKENTFKLH